MNEFRVVRYDNGPRNPPTAIEAELPTIEEAYGLLDELNRDISTVPHSHHDNYLASYFVEALVDDEWIPASRPEESYA
jgi:hypothetical protein